MGSFIGRRFIQTHGELVDLAIFSGTGGDPGIARYAGKAVAYVSGKRKALISQMNFLIHSYSAALIRELTSLKQNLTGFQKIQMWSNRM